MSFLTSSTLGGGGGTGGGGNGVEPFPDPFCDYASLAMPETLDDALWWCITPGTPIELADLSYKPIEDIVAGDVVLTRKGEHHPVKATSVREVDEEIVNLTFAGIGKYNKLRLTQNHNVFVVRGGKRPSQLSLSFDAAEKVPAGEVCVGDYFVTPVPIRKPPEPCRFDGWLVGMYIAEGCLVRDDERTMLAKFTLGDDDERTGVMQKLVTATTEATGRQQKATTPNTRPDVRLVTVSDAEMAGWFAEHCPGLADSKTLSGACLTWRNETILRVLAGWLDGDGYTITQKGKFRGAQGSTACRTLAMQLQRLANAAGLAPSLSERSNSRGFAEGKEDSRECMLKFGKADCVKLQPYSVKLTNAKEEFGDLTAASTGAVLQFVKNGYVFRKVTGYELEEYQGPVHNFEVDEDHSYIAGGVAVANCEFIMLANGVYRSAMSRVISYFITDIEIEDADRDTKQKYMDFLHNTLGILPNLRTIGLDYLTYGNSFLSLTVPFRRYLSCPRCGFEAPLRNVQRNSSYNFGWNWDFKANCPHCEYTGKWTHTDRRSNEEDALKIKRWNPKEMELLWDPYTDNVQHIWKLPNYYRQHLAQGREFHLENAPWEVIQAAKNNNYLRFNDDVIYHAKEETFAGVLNKGWGISRVLTNFRQAWYVQVLHRYNEAIALDYIIPFRVITPMPRGGGTSGGGMETDPLFSADMGGFVGQINSMLATRRRDPASWHASPYPLQYQSLGAEASQMAPHELVDQGIDTLLNSCDIPTQFYRGDLTLQAAPAALRLLESNWSHLTHVLNRILQWLVNKISVALDWDKVKISLAKPSHVDDLNRQLAKLQMSTARQISQTTGLKSIGLDYEDEQDKMLDEEKYVAEKSKKTQEELEAMGMGDAMAQGMMGPQAGGPAGGAPMGGPGAPGGAPVGPPAPGGAPPAPGGAPPGGDPAMGQDPVQAVIAMLPQPNEKITPQEMVEKATVISQQLFMMQEGQKDSALRQIKQKAPHIHGLVKSQLEEQRNQAKNQGVAMAQQAAQAQGAPVPIT